MLKTGKMKHSWMKLEKKALYERKFLCVDINLIFFTFFKAPKPLWLLESMI